MAVKSVFALLFLPMLALSQSLSNPHLANFSTLQTGFAAILGPSPAITLLYNASEPLFHEAAVYIPATDSLFVVSNRVELPHNGTDPSTTNQTIYLNEVTNVSSSDLAAIRVEPISTSTIALPNGGTNFLGTKGIIVAAQGSKNHTGGLYVIPDPVSAPNTSVPLVTSFYGHQFNSPNDVVVNPYDHSVYFTDPDYGFQQGLRNASVLPNQVYRYDPATNSTRVVADGFVEPNGLAFSPDYKIMYITDTGANLVKNGPATIYAFDVLPGPFLGNRRVFAYAPHGQPDGIKLDTMGNVYSGTGDGVTVWSPAGLLLGEIMIHGGVANLGFGKPGMLFAMGETYLWRIELASSVIGALLSGQGA